MPTSNLKPHQLMRQALEAGTLCEDAILEAVQRQMTTLDNPGFCLKCGSHEEECEPDARGYKCSNCGSRTVYGAQECLMMLTPF